jgi:hypothetical protein
MPGRFKTQSSSLRLDREKHQAATTKNTVVGSPGTTIPMPPSPTQTRPASSQTTLMAREEGGT